MTETEEDWVHLAMGDACLVADLLLRLLRDRPPPSSHAWLDWTVRGRRSRSQPRNTDGITKKEAMVAEPKLKQARASPSTPLSWSGAASTSGGGGASEESPSPVDNCHSAGSKVCPLVLHDADTRDCHVTWLALPFSSSLLSYVLPWGLVSRVEVQLEGVATTTTNEAWGGLKLVAQGIGGGGGVGAFVPFTFFALTEMPL